MIDSQFYKHGAISILWSVEVSLNLTINTCVSQLGSHRDGKFNGRQTVVGS